MTVEVTTIEVIVKETVALIRESHNECSRYSCPWKNMWDEDVEEFVLVLKGKLNTRDQQIADKIYESER